jgi:hypothetical protein
MQPIPESFRVVAINLSDSVFIKWEWCKSEENEPLTEDPNRIDHLILQHGVIFYLELLLIVQK